MYHAFVCINIAFRVQRYDIFLNAVSLAYGKSEERGNLETATNQVIMKKEALNPMEKCR